MRTTIQPSFDSSEGPRAVLIDSWIAERVDLIIHKAEALQKVEILERARPGSCHKRIRKHQLDFEAACKGTLLMIRHMRDRGRLIKAIHLLGAGVALIEIGSDLQRNGGRYRWNWGHCFDPERLGDRLLSSMDSDLGFTDKLRLKGYVKFEKPVPLPVLFLTWQNHFESHYRHSSLTEYRQSPER